MFVLRISFSALMLTALILAILLVFGLFLSLFFVVRQLSVLSQNIKKLSGALLESESALCSLSVKVDRMHPLRVNDSVRTIQSWWRGVLINRRRHQVVVKMQSLARGWIQRKKKLREAAAAIRIQKTFRCFLLRDAVQSLKSKRIFFLTRSGSDDVQLWKLLKSWDKDQLLRRRDTRGATLLMAACLSRRADIADFILQSFEDLECRWDQGNIEETTLNRYIKEKDLAGWNALMYAVEGGDEQCVLRMLKFLNPVSRSSFRFLWSPMDLSRHYRGDNFERIAKILGDSARNFNGGCQEEMQTSEASWENLCGVDENEILSVADDRRTEPPHERVDVNYKRNYQVPKFFMSSYNFAAYEASQQARKSGTWWRGPMPGHLHDKTAGEAEEDSAGQTGGVTSAAELRIREREAHSERRVVKEIEDLSQVVEDLLKMMESCGTPAHVLPDMIDRSVRFYPAGDEPLKVDLYTGLPLNGRKDRSRFSNLNLASQSPKVSKPGFKVCNTEATLVRETLLYNGFMPTTGSDWQVLWSGSHLKEVCYHQLHENQKVNHFPGSGEVTRKDKLWSNCQILKKYFGSHVFDFLPETFVLPDQVDKFFETYETNPDWIWIVKPTAQSRGRGIFLLRELSSLPLDSTSVVSKYVEDPFLIQGLKFDIRIYVLVTGLDPMRIYVYREGLTRLACSPFSIRLIAVFIRTGKDLDNKFKHLTNYSICKMSDRYVENSDVENDNMGHKWSLSALNKHLRCLGVDVDKMWERIIDMILKTLLCTSRNINSRLARQSCFELFGFDVLLDSSLKPWLLEVNLSPSLQADTPLDRKIKCNLIADVLNIVGIPPSSSSISAPFDLPTHARNKIGPRSKSMPTRDPDPGSPFIRRLQSIQQSVVNATRSAHAPPSLGSLGSDKSVPDEKSLKVLSSVLAEFKRHKDESNFIRVYPTRETARRYRHFLTPENKHTILLLETLYPGTCDGLFKETKKARRMENAFNADSPYVPSVSGLSGLSTKTPSSRRPGPFSTASPSSVSSLSVSRLAAHTNSSSLSLNLKKEKKKKQAAALGGQLAGGTEERKPFFGASLLQRTSSVGTLGAKGLLQQRIGNIRLPPKFPKKAENVELEHGCAEEVEGGEMIEDDVCADLEEVDGGKALQPRKKLGGLLLEGSTADMEITDDMKQLEFLLPGSSKEGGLFAQLTFFEFCERLCVALESLEQDSRNKLVASKVWKSCVNLCMAVSGPSEVCGVSSLLRAIRGGLDLIATSIWADRFGPDIQAGNRKSKPLAARYVPLSIARSDAGVRILDMISKLSTSQIERELQMSGSPGLLQVLLLSEAYTPGLLTRVMAFKLPPRKRGESLKEGGSTERKPRVVAAMGLTHANFGRAISLPEPRKEIEL